MVATIGCSRPKMTMAPLRAPHRSPARSTTATPKAVSAGVPTTSQEARQLVRMNIIPTDRSMPAVMTTSVCAIATKASRTPLLEAV
jgi:hypothetical protein